MTFASSSGPDEQPLVGGNNTVEVSRIGDTVRRSRSRRSGEVAELLLFLEKAGYEHAPKYLGIDDVGRQVLSFIPGETTDHPSQRAPGAYGTAGRMLRQLHDVTAGYPGLRGGECVIHGDPGPYNTICRDGAPLAFIDWDSARPGRRLDDLGYLAWTWCVQTEGAVAIDDQARHLRELRDGYDVGVSGPHLLAAMVGRQLMIEAAETSNQDDGELTAVRRKHAMRAVGWARSARLLVQGNEQAFLASLE